MLDRYDFFSPGQIAFGWGRRSELGRLAAAHGRRAFVISGSRTLERSPTFGELLDSVRSAGISVELVATISREPEVSDVDELVADLLRLGVCASDCLIAVGGGSAIDLAKAASALVTNRGSSTVKDYLEGVGAGLQIEEQPVPLIAVPTTSGTGTEATKNAVISSYDPPFKKSLRSPLMIPRAVLIDPELSVGLSPQTTAYTGMDAITQLIESFISRRSQPIPDALCLQGIALALPAIIEAVEHGESQSARTAMSHAALLSGIALANSGLGMAHGVAAALGVHAKIPHGLACAVMLPVAMRVNRPVVGDRLAQLGRTMHSALQAAVVSQSGADSRADLSKILAIPDERSLDDDSAVEFAVRTIETICRRVKIPATLTEVGVARDQIPDIVKSSRGNSMSGNPRDLTDTELTTVLTEITDVAHARCS